MAWQEDRTENTERVVDEKWLKIPDAPIGKTSEVKLRILDEEPVGVWRHWQNDRPYNCPGIYACPICKVRMAAKTSDPNGYKAKFRMDYRYFFNVLVDEKVKIFSFSSSVGRKLKMFLEKYGDLRDYDVSIMKRKTGPLPMNVEYDVIYEGKTETNPVIADLTRFDLSEYIVPENQEVLSAVAAGEKPAPSENAEAAPAKATKADMIVLKALVEQKGYQLGEFGIVETSPPSKEVVEKLIKELQTEK